MRPIIIVVALVLSTVVAAAAVPRPQPDGSGPFLDRVTQPIGDPASLERNTRRIETYVDIEASLFVPGKADPADWMATGTWARITFDGISYQYGYDPLTQSYDMMVSGYVDPNYGILAQETVGVLAVPLPSHLAPGSVERVEIRFHVEQHNLYPFESVGIVAMSDAITPRSGLNSLDARLLYEDARGFSGTAYVVDHFDVGAHAIDLGSIAVDDLEARIASGDDWFALGFAADGWDLSQSWGQQVFWRMDGGGQLPESLRPVLRVVFNAPPVPAELTLPDDGATVSNARPSLAWDPSTDPNGDAPITYRVSIGTDPLLVGAVTFDVGEATTARPPFDLAPGSYVWAVEATDPRGATTRSATRELTIAVGTDAPARPDAVRLRAAPNPFNPRTTLAATLPVAGRWTLHLVDRRGRRIHTVETGDRPAGTWQWTWDGRDATGSPVASGIYEALLVGPDGRAARTRLTLVR